MDGVLWNSSVAHASSFEAVIEQNNLRIQQFQYSKYSGMSTEEAWEKILRDNNLLETERRHIKKFTFEKRNAFARHRQTVELNDNLLMAASRLNSDGWGIVTSGSTESVNSFLKRSSFATRFQSVISSQDVQTAKPSPEGYIKACTWFEVTPDSCVVFEDSIAGLEAAAAAEMSAVHVLDVKLTTCTLHNSEDKATNLLGCVSYSGTGLEKIVGSKIF